MCRLSYWGTSCLPARPNSSHGYLHGNGAHPLRVYPGRSLSTFCKMQHTNQLGILHHAARLEMQASTLWQCWHWALQVHGEVRAAMVAPMPRPVPNQLALGPRTKWRPVLLIIFCLKLHWPDWLCQDAGHSADLSCWQTTLRMQHMANNTVCMQHMANNSVCMQHMASLMCFTHAVLQLLCPLLTWRAFFFMFPCILCISILCAVTNCARLSSRAHFPHRAHFCSTGGLLVLKFPPFPPMLYVLAIVCLRDWMLTMLASGPDVYMACEAIWRSQFVPVLNAHPRPYACVQCSRVECRSASAFCYAWVFPHSLAVCAPLPSHFI